MSTKSEVLQLLNKNGNGYISGQQMAEELYVTRAAVWKAIKSLQNDGYPIEAVTNRGYRIVNHYNLPDEKLIKKYVEDNGFDVCIDNIRFNILDEAESTNDSVRDLACEDFAVVIAGRQTRGRGRRGRSFYSPKGTGIYISILIHPNMSAREATRLTCIMAVAICRAIEKVTGINAQIKWVNDIFYNNKKVAGILTEAVTSIEDGSLSYVIMGAGINLYEPTEGFPADIRNTAGYLLDKQTDVDLGSRLCGAIIGSFFEIYNSGTSDYVEEYRSKSMLIGSYVKVMQYQNETDNNKSGNLYAYVEGIDDECHLIVRYDDGKTDHLSTGEVSVVKY